MYLFRTGSQVTTCIVDNLNFRRFEIPSDGNCLFASIALGYNKQFGTNYIWKDIKLMILKRFFEEKHNKEYRDEFYTNIQWSWIGFEQVNIIYGGDEGLIINYATHYYLETLKSSATYFNKLVKISTLPRLQGIQFGWQCYWGNEFEIGQIAKYLNVSITVYSIKNTEFNYHKIGSVIINETALYKLYLLFTGSHYECLHLTSITPEQPNFVETPISNIKTKQLDLMNNLNT